MHWKHSKYQIVYTIVANCHTYDEAYRVLRELEEDYDLSVKLASAEYKRINAKEIAANIILKDETETEYNKMNSQADLDSVHAKHPSLISQMQVAKDTLAFIRQCIELVAPHRMFSEYTDQEAHQRCQYLEWKCDLLWKSYNMICASGSMAYDHFINIKMHPEANKIMRIVEEFLQVVRDGNHQNLLTLTKADVLSKVVNNSEVIMPTITTVFERLSHDSIIPRLTSGNAET